MDKIKYTKPEMEIIAFESEDVIVTSPVPELPDDTMNQMLGIDCGI